MTKIKSNRPKTKIKASARPSFKFNGGARVLAFAQSIEAAPGGMALDNYLSKTITKVIQEKSGDINSNQIGAFIAKARTYLRQRIKDTGVNALEMAVQSKQPLNRQALEVLNKAVTEAIG